MCSRRPTTLVAERMVRISWEKLVIRVLIGDLAKVEGYLDIISCEIPDENFEILLRVLHRLRRDIKDLKRTIGCA